MSEQDVLNMIRQWIVANHNNLITADVLRPILEAMLAQPNDKAGELTDLQTLDRETLVAAINEVNQKISDSGFMIHTGSGTPNDTPPAEFSIGDFYIHENNGVQGFYQFTGSAWVQISNKLNNKVTEIFLGLVPTAGLTTTVEEVADYVNSTTFEVFDNETLILSLTGKSNGIPVYISYFFKRNNISGLWGTGQPNGEIVADDLLLNFVGSNLELLEAEGEVVLAGDIGAASIWNYVNSHVEPTLGEWDLAAGTLYFFRYTQNGQVKTALYEGPLPVQLGTGGGYTATEADFSIIADTSEVSKQYVDDQDATVTSLLMGELDKYILLTQKGVAMGVATLGSDGKIPDSQLPNLAITDVITATQTTFTAFLSNTGSYTFEKGDVVIIPAANGNEHWIYKGGTKTTAANYSKIAATSVEISQVNGLQAYLDGFDTDIDTLTLAINTANNEINSLEDRVLTLENEPDPVETDPTVPAHVKAIAQIDIDDWDLAASKRLVDVVVTSPDTNTRRFTFSFADNTTIVRDVGVGAAASIPTLQQVLDAGSTATINQVLFETSGYEIVFSVMTGRLDVKSKASGGWWSALTHNQLILNNGTTARSTFIVAGANSSNWTLTTPNKSGIIAVTSDIPAAVAAMTLAQLNAGTETTARTIAAKTLADWALKFATIRLANLPSDLSTAEKDAIKTKLSIAAAGIYDTMTLTSLNLGSDDTAKVITAAVLHQWLTGKNYLTSETDPTVPAHVKAITAANITSWNSKDNYDGWNLKTGGVQRIKIGSGGTLDIVVTGNGSVAYSAGGVVTINIPTQTPDLSKVVKVDISQSFSVAEKTQARTNIDAEKLSDVTLMNGNPTNQQFIDNNKNTFLVTTGSRNFVLPAAGVLPDKHQFMVKTGSGGQVNFSKADGTVTIEYNDMNAIGYMSQRSEAWVLFHNNIYYVNGEVV